MPERPFFPTTWQELLDDPILRPLPFRKERKSLGQIVMDRHPPAHHDEQVAHLAALLRERRPDGEVFIDAGVDTADNTKLVDAVWASPARRVDPVAGSFTVAPEICVEVLAPGDSPEHYVERGQLFLGAGAEEFWLCDEPGDVRFFDAAGLLERSRLCPDFPGRIELRR